MNDYYEDEVPGPECPYCGEKEPCDHMVCAIDGSNAELVGGYLCDRQDELIQTISRGFQRFFKNATYELPASDSPLYEIVRTAADRYEEYYSEGEPEYGDLIDWSVLTGTVENMMSEDCQAFGWEIDGPPGYSNVYTNVYHEKADEYVTTWLRRLEALFDVLANEPGDRSAGDQGES